MYVDLGLDQPRPISGRFFPVLIRPWKHQYLPYPPPTHHTHCRTGCSVHCTLQACNPRRRIELTSGAAAALSLGRHNGGCLTSLCLLMHLMYNVRMRHRQPRTLRACAQQQASKQLVLRLYVAISKRGDSQTFHHDVQIPAN